MNNIVRVFKDTDMRNQHAGLRMVAAKANVNLDALDQHEHVVFLNSKKNRIKAFSFNGVISYLYSEKEPLDLNALVGIVQTFSPGAKANVNEAVKKALSKKLNKKLQIKNKADIAHLTKRGYDEANIRRTP